MRSSSISVRGLAAIAALCALLCAAAASASAAPLVWVPNELEESVSTYDSSTGKEVASPVKVGSEPTSIAITPDGRRAIVLERGSQSARVIETGTRTPLKPIPLGAIGQSVAVAPNGKAAYVTVVGEPKILVINPQTAALAGSFTVDGGALGQVAFAPDGTYAYVGTGAGELARVEVASQKAVGTPIVLGGAATSIVFTPDGSEAFVTAEGVKGVRVIDTALGEVVKTIPTATVPSTLAVSPDGKKLYIGTESPGSISVAEIATGNIVGTPIGVPAGVSEFAVTPDGKSAWAVGGKTVTPINLLAGRAGTGIATGEVTTLAIAPDQSPLAAFTVPPGVIVGVPATFSGAASTDADGSVASWNWAFGDGRTATGMTASHTYTGAGTFNAQLNVVDNEGCGEEEVFTGRGAYCSGALPAVHPVTVKASVVAPVVTAPPSNNIRFGRIVHNRRNGTVRVQVRLPSAGFVLLFGKKVHAVTRKSKGVQWMWLTLHARVELAKRLKKILHVPVRFRVTFTPDGGASRTVHRSVTLQRAPRHKHHGH
jgi:DNA-binding beta-propeller fold protein YncE